MPKKIKLIILLLSVASAAFAAETSSSIEEEFQVQSEIKISPQAQVAEKTERLSQSMRNTQRNQAFQKNREKFVKKLQDNQDETSEQNPLVHEAIFSIYPLDVQRPKKQRIDQLEADFENISKFYMKPHALDKIQDILNLRNDLLRMYQRYLNNGESEENETRDIKEIVSKLHSNLYINDEGIVRMSESICNFKPFASHNSYKLLHPLKMLLAPYPPNEVQLQEKTSIKAMFSHTGHDIPGISLFDKNQDAIKTQLQNFCHNYRDSYRLMEGPTLKEMQKKKDLLHASPVSRFHALLETLESRGRMESPNFPVFEENSALSEFYQALTKSLAQYTVSMKKIKEDPLEEVSESQKPIISNTYLEISQITFREYNRHLNIPQNTPDILEDLRAKIEREMSKKPVSLVFKDIQDALSKSLSYISKMRVSKGYNPPKHRIVKYYFLPNLSKSIGKFDRKNGQAFSNELQKVLKDSYGYSVIQNSGGGGN